MKSTVVCVIGMGRAGTSAITRSLAGLDVYLGEDMMPPAPDNPRGFWENAALFRTNVELLEAQGRSWASLSGPRLPNLEDPQVKAVRTRAAEYIEKEFGSRPLWGFKDPRTTRLLPFWRGLFNELGIADSYIVAVRHPADVAASLEHREKMPSEMAITLWCLYMLDAFTETEGAPVIAVNYDLLLEDPAGQLARLAKWLGRDAPTGKALDQVLDWLTPELRHSHTGGDRLPIGSRTAWLYEVAADLAADRIDLQAVRPELRELRTALSGQPILDLIDSELAGEDRLRGWEGFQGPASDREEAISELAQLLDAERQRNSLLANEVDDMRDGLEELARELEAQRTETAASVANSANINEQLQESELRVGALEVELDVMRASTSWLVTAPLRRLTRGIRSAAPVSRPEEKKKS